ARDKFIGGTEGTQGLFRRQWLFVVLALAQAALRVHRRDGGAERAEPGNLLQRPVRGGGGLSHRRALSRGAAKRAGQILPVRGTRLSALCNTMVTTAAYMKDNSDVVARFTRASVEGWKDYLRDPSAGNALI